ncbi:AbrB family transcriptional regulator [Bacillus horti]|uniref:Membrane AbrB-like protein n=1 Tax=Caldalkalibacillus horti TaxID=77523 RepID=A0ABT9VTQ5_9BACI|nr:AbrB family transcriptional regulator [Bacillus horti]MDQ0164362.1 membrane AbrB-like protein [Bacillus horti]
MDTLLFICLAFIGGKIGLKLKLPAGALIGAMLLVGAVKMLTEILEYFQPGDSLRFMVQMFLGAMIGLMFSKRIRALRVKELLMILVVGASSLVSSILFGWSFHSLFNQSLGTSIIAATPGGIAEMLTLADSVHADTQVVAFVHVMRFMILVLSLRLLIPYIKAKSGNHQLGEGS